MGIIPLKKSKNVASILEQYTGSHTVSFFTLQKDRSLSSNIQNINVPATIDSHLFYELFSLFNQSKKSRMPRLVNSLFKETNSLSLDQVCLLYEYFSVMPERSEEKFLKIHLPYVFESQISLFSLSYNFFTKNEKLFFKQWKSISKKYSEGFWISFWTDQLWRAYNVTKLSQEGNSIQAHKIAYRLPSFFIKKGWQKCSLNELFKSFEFVYTMDFLLKKGSSFCAFDLFYCNYFQGYFS